MNWRQVGVVCGTALTTMAFTIMLAAPRGLDAGGAASIKPAIAQPKFESQGCIFELQTDKAEYQPGDKLVLNVDAFNSSPESANAAVWINVFAAAPSSPLSRMIVVPKLLWSHECEIQLGPGERKSGSVAVDVELPEGKQISIVLSDKKNEVMARSLGVRNLKDRPDGPLPAERGFGAEPQK